MVPYKERYTFEQRKDEATRILEKYPERAPVIVEMSQRGQKNNYFIEREKYLFPKDLTVGQALYALRKRITPILSSEKAIYLFVNNNLPPTSQLMGALYEQEKEECGFLYMEISFENTFG